MTTLVERADKRNTRQNTGRQCPLLLVSRGDLKALVCVTHVATKLGID